MSDAPKISLDLTAHQNLLFVQADSPVGDARAESKLALLDPILANLQHVNLLNIPNAEIEEIGHILYRSIFSGQVSELGKIVINEGIDQKVPVEMEIRLDADQVFLAKFPWEMLADSFNRLVVRDGLVNLTRYIKFLQPKPELNIDPNDWLLRVISKPTDLQQIQTFRLPIQPIKTIPHATFNLFVHKILMDQINAWGIHFDGHGGVRRRCKRCDLSNDLSRENCESCGAELKTERELGFLAFEKNKKADWISAKEFGPVLFNADIQFALLLACETGNTGGEFIFNGVAPNLVLAGIPAVIGMQYPIYDHFANEFLRSFYTSLKKERDISKALGIARRVNLRGSWYSPVLYLRHKKPASENGIIYKIRYVDSAVPAKVKIGTPFLARLWIRRPETQPTKKTELQRQLGISGEIDTQTQKTEIKFEHIEKRKLRLGTIEVRLTSPFCKIIREKRQLFLSEDLDAPPAIFAVTPMIQGSIPLVFTISQGGIDISVITHTIECETTKSSTSIEEYQLELPVETEVHAVEISDKRVSPEATKATYLDVVILTTLPEEFQAVRSQIPNLKRWTGDKREPSSYAWQTGTISNELVGPPYKVALGMTGPAGSALAVREALERWSPRYIFFVGIAGGLGSMELGDVMVANSIYEYEHGKAKQEFQPRTDWSYRIDQGLLSSFRAYALDRNWSTRIRATSPQTRTPRFETGTIASGDIMVNNPTGEFFAQILAYLPTIKAVEMEGAGIPSAIKQADATARTVGFAVIRGISDIPRSVNERGTTDKSHWETYAASVAAAFTTGYIANGLPVPPRDEDDWDASPS